MTFISHAQNFEDVMLWRALKHIENGFYIDAGAWSPDEDSVTRAFYERGWRGINIEPNPFWFDRLCEKRSEDINLPYALSDKEKILNLYIVVDTTGLSTTDLEYAEKSKESGQTIQEVSCQALTLKEIWDEHVGQNQVHFLKIDVEGSEESIIRGNDWLKNRPWIIVLEAVLPNTQITTHHVWEHYLLDANYSHVYSDGINRYYLAKEHSDLATAFTYPPNLFDQFKLSSHAQAETSVHTLSRQYQELLHQYQNLSDRVNVLEAQLSATFRILSDLRKTRIYRIARRLHQWGWLEEKILSVTHSKTESKRNAKQ